MCCNFFFSPFHRGPLNQMIRKIAKKTGNGDFTTFLFLFSPYSAEPTVSKNLNSLSDCCRPANIYKCGENKLQSLANRVIASQSILLLFYWHFLVFETHLLPQFWSEGLEIHNTVGQLSKASQEGKIFQIKPPEPSPSSKRCHQ